MTKRRPAHERQTRPPMCVACGGAAAGYNYNAPSCHSCKTFFRRAVMKQRVYNVCLKNGACDEIEGFPPCRGCRFDRCVKGGMNPHLISNHENPGTNEAVQKFLKKYEEQKPSTSRTSISTDDSNSPQEAAEDTPCDPHHMSTVEEPTSMQLMRNPYQFETKLEKMMQNLLRLETAHHELRISTYSPRILTESTIDDHIFGASKLGGHFPPMSTEAYEPMAVQLVPAEFFIKHRIVISFGDFDYSKKKLWIAQDLLYGIEFIKALPIYHLLDESSKRVLLASVTTCANITAAYYSYLQHSDRTCYPDGGVMCWKKEMQEQSPGSTHFHTALIAAMREVDLDKREYALLKMIAICNPLLEGLSSDDIVLLQQERERCTKTLVSYVLASRGVKNGPAHITKLFSLIEVLAKVTTWQKSQQILMMAMGLHASRCLFAEAVFHSS